MRCGFFHVFSGEVKGKAGGKVAANVGRRKAGKKKVSGFGAAKSGMDGMAGLYAGLE